MNVNIKVSCSSLSKEYFWIYLETKRVSGNYFQAPFVFLYSNHIKRLGSLEKMKLYFLSVLDNPLTKYVITKEFLAKIGCIELFTKLIRSLKAASSEDFLQNFQKKIYFVKLYYLPSFNLKPQLPSKISNCMFSKFLFRNVMISL